MSQQLDCNEPPTKLAEDTESDSRRSPMRMVTDSLVLVFRKRRADGSGLNRIVRPADVLSSLRLRRSIRNVGERLHKPQKLGLSVVSRQY